MTDYKGYKSIEAVLVAFQMGYKETSYRDVVVSHDYLEMLDRIYDR